MFFDDVHPGLLGQAKILVSPLNVRDPSSLRVAPTARKDPKRCRPWPSYGSDRSRGFQPGRAVARHRQGRPDGTAAGLTWARSC